MANIPVRRGWLVVAGVVAGVAIFSMANTEPTALASLQRPGDFPPSFWNRIVLLQSADTKIHTAELRDVISRYAYGSVPVGWEDQKAIAKAIAREEGQRRTDRGGDNPGSSGPSAFQVPMPAHPPPPPWGRP